MMLGTLIYKELLDHLLSLRFTITCLLCFFVMLMSLIVRSTDYQQVQEDYHQDSAADRRQMIDARGPWEIVWGRTVVRRPPNPLKVFVRGASDENGAAARISTYAPPQALAPDIRSGVSRMFPPVDMVAFVGLIMSLMAILFGYDAICGEKQNGTLRLMLSYAVPRDKVLAAKWIGGFAALLAPYAFAVTAILLVVQVQKSVDFTSDQWMRLSVILLLSVLYLAVMYTLALWVSALTSRPGTSVMVLVTLWVVMVLATPNLAPHLALFLSPSQGRQKLEIERFEKSREIWQKLVEDRRKIYDDANGFGKEWWKNWDWSNTEAKLKARRRWRVHFGYEHEAVLAQQAMYGKLDDPMDAELDRQMATTRILGRLSPYACFTFAAAELAGEGPLVNRHFRKQMRTYNETCINYGAAEFLWYEDYRLEHNDQRPKPWPDSRQNPPPLFAYQAPASTEHFKAVAVDAGILGGLVIVFFLGAYMSFIRYDVR